MAQMSSYLEAKLKEAATYSSKPLAETAKEAKTVSKDAYDHQEEIMEKWLGHTEHQPAPVQLEGKPSTPVLPYVLQDFRDKAKVGLDKYHTMLRTNNGRDALADAYQEAVDKVMYLKQLLMEQDLEAGRDHLWQLDIDLAQEATWWKQQEEMRQLQDRADFLEETRALDNSRVEHYQQAWEKARSDLRDVLMLLRDVLLAKRGRQEMLEQLLYLAEKYGR
jgi:cell division protein FtsB